jgi:hypothetical protein
MKRFDLSIKQIAVIVFFVLLLLYTLFQARFLILGPVIYIDSPYDGELEPTSVIIIKGRAKNIAYISLNDRPIFIDSNGNWSEKYALSEGLSIITLKASDRFGRKTEKTVRLVYKQANQI